MRRLLLLRHAKAERAKAGERDIERHLADRGRRDGPTMGAYMRKEGLVPDAAAVSPSTRTRETWTLIAGTLKRSCEPELEERLYDATPDDILGVIKETKSTAGTLLVVGHNPGLHELAVWLIGSGEREARERLADALPTSGLVVIDFTARSWKQLRPRTGRLERFVTPKWLAAAD